MGNLKREYLNSEEKNVYMISKAYVQLLNGERNLENRITNEIWVEWEKRGMITPSMQKSLKMVNTYLRKFCYEVEENLNDKERKRLSKQLEKFDYKLIDDYTVKKLMRDIKDNMNYICIERDKFLDVLEDIAAVRCVGCTSDYRECSIYKALDDISTPYLGEEPNCPYAADLTLCTNKQRKEIDILKERMSSKNQLYKGRV